MINFLNLISFTIIPEIFYKYKFSIMTQRDVVGREVGGGVHVWEHMYTLGGFMSMYGKTNAVL